MALALACAPIVLATSAFAQTPLSPLFRTVYTFTNGTDGASPSAALLLLGGTLYGTASEGGADKDGTVYAVNVDGTGFRSLHDFSVLEGTPFSLTNLDGAFPVAGLVMGGNTVYGTAKFGGTNGCGTVFAVNTDGTGFMVLHTFAGSDGNEPRGGLILSGNTLYGMTAFGGANGAGTVYAVNTDGTGFGTLSNPAAGWDADAPESSLIISSNTLYGTSYGGGANGWGFVFALNTDGTGFRTVYSFSTPEYIGNGLYTNLDGAYPACSLVLSGGRLFGTASIGGTNGFGTVFAVNTDGTGFAVLLTLTAVGGTVPGTGLVLSGNALVGTAAYGGTNDDGSVFSINTDGTGFAVLHTFDGLDGGFPVAPLILSNNTFYGTAENGGTNGAGTIFAITLVPAPAVVPASIAASGGQLQFEVTGITPGATVYVQAAGNLSAPVNWLPIATNLVTGTNLTVSGLSTTNSTWQFFRVAETLPP
jgi:uncharacterized repeat protein (TIGR03803 family)